MHVLSLVGYDPGGHCAAQIPLYIKSYPGQLPQMEPIKNTYWKLKYCTKFWLIAKSNVNLDPVQLVFKLIF
jgi:hypothetical protein